MLGFVTPDVLSTLLFGFALFVFAPCLGMFVYSFRAASARYREDYPRNHRVQEKMPLWLLSESFPRLREKLRLDPTQDAILLAAISRFYRWQRFVQIAMFISLLLLVARLVAN